MHNRLIIYCLCFLGSSLSLFSQQRLTFEHITTAQGLSQNSVQCIYQDRKGYLWFGTDDGLNRFDGITFTTFKHDPGNPHTLSSPNITAVKEDRDGLIWVSSKNGFDCLNPLTGMVIRYLPGDSAKDANWIPAFFIDTTALATKNGTQKVFWLATFDRGLLKMTLTGDQVTFQQYRHSADDAHSISSNVVRFIYQDAKGVLWFGTVDGVLDQFVASTSSFYHNYVDSVSRKDCNVTNIFRDSRNQVWASVRLRGVYHVSFDKDTNDTSIIHATFVPIRIRNSNSQSSLQLPTAFAEDRDGNIWLCSLYNGLDQLVPNEDGSYTIVQYTADVNNSAGISSNVILSICVSRDNILWIGDASYGINKARLQKQMALYRHTANDSTTIPAKSICGMYEAADRTLYVGGYGEFVTLNRTTGKVTVCKARNTSTGILQNVAWNVYAITPDAFYGDSVLWLGIDGGNLIRYSVYNAQFTEFRCNPKDSNSLSNQTVWTLCTDTKGHLWIGELPNVQELVGTNTKNPKFITYRHDPSNPKSLSSGIYHSIYQSSSGILWFGSGDAGIDAMLPAAPGEFLHYAHHPEDSTSLSMNDVRTICEDSKGRMWFGTYGGGLNMLLPDGKSFKHYFERDGLPGNAIHGILEDSSGHLWISTNRGLSRFTPETGEFWNLTMSDGLQDYEFNTGSCYKSRHGEMFFGGINGFNAFYPGQLNKNTYVAPVYITSLRLFGNEIPKDRLASAKGLVFGYNEDVLTFEFTSLDYSSPERDRFEYKLDGNNDTWIPAGNRRYVSYAHLGPGTYTFQVRGANSDGIWNEQAAQMLFTITPPYWETFWFRGIIVALFLSIGLMLYFRKMKILEKEQKLRIEFSQQLIVSQEQERERIAKDMHDSIGQNLLVVKNQAYLATRSFPDQPNVLNQFGQIAGIMDETIKEVRQISRNLRPYQLAQIGLSDTIKVTLRKISEAVTDIAFHVDIADLEGALTKDSEIHVFRIVQEVVNNIIKHSHAKNATICVARTAEAISLSLSDDGQGYDATEHSGRSGNVSVFGLKGIEERVAILKGTMTITTARGKGTTIEITIPTK